MKNFVTVNWLKDNLNKVILLDVREEYEKGHIPGAISLELESKLTVAIEKHGGRHPMPTPEEFEKTLQKAGLSLDDNIVCYDSGELAYAGRLWWMLKFMGFTSVKVLEGGYPKWIEAGGESSTEEVLPIPNPDLKVNVLEDIALSMEHVRDNIIYNPDVALVDSRAAERYRGEIEPLDFKAGHIPSAYNYPYETMIAEGEIPSEEKLREWYKDLFDYKDVVVYCGSGITATVNILLMEEAGLKPKLYCGSFSDWITYPENEINTTER
ncbi:MAG: sulfurtransferase [Tissierellia bacterium]|nr:sulfurtransferase [Tissierellia bacterium]